MPDERLRDTWHSEQWVIDRLVEAVETGNATAKRRLGDHLVRGYSEHDWHRGRIVEDGFFLAPTALDASRATPSEVIRLFMECDEGIEEERYEELSGGAAITADELARWRELVVSEAFYDGTVWVVIAVKHSRRGRCCIGVLHWNSPDERFVAAYATRAEVVNALKQEGYVSEADFVARHQHRRE